MSESATTIEKAIDVLFYLHRETAPQGITAVSRALGLPKSSAHRLLKSLRGRGLVESDERGRYRPGIALVALGLGALEREPVVEIARPVLEAEARALGETVFLVAARAAQLLVLAKAEGTGFLRAAPRVGTAVPLHATAVGKLYLALDPSSVKAPGASPERATAALERFTARTPSTRRELDRAVALVAERGYAESHEEWIRGLSVIAAPVACGGKLHAALAIAMPSARMADEDVARIAHRAVTAADQIAATLAGRPI
jgi:DNA-binding IclR family transcriptional regulator